VTHCFTGDALCRRRRHRAGNLGKRPFGQITRR
jgi:hypothetical protein